MTKVTKTINKQKYRTLCDQENSIPLFNQAWWLDAVAGNSWDVVLFEKQQQIVAAMPYITKRKFFITSITQPLLTQHMGPWIIDLNGKSSKKLSLEKEIIQKLYSSLPKYDYLNHNWHYKNKNWLPIFWKKFQQSTSYTYILENIYDTEKIWKNLQDNIKSDIKKSSKLVTIKTDSNIEEFWELNTKVFKRQNIKIPYSFELVKRIDNAAVERNARKIFIAIDNQGRQHAGVYIVWDANSAYYLMGGGDPELRNSGATSLCMWEAIKYVSNTVDTFDFEGSMIEPIERYFRAFGATQTPYFSISKINSLTVKTYKFIQNLLHK